MPDAVPPSAFRETKRKVEQFEFIFSPPRSARFLQLEFPWRLYRTRKVNRPNFRQFKQLRELLQSTRH
jgi:hypothetical protein